MGIERVSRGEGFRDRPEEITPERQERPVHRKRNRSRGIEPQQTDSEDDEFTGGSTKGEGCRKEKRVVC